jgi:hypothetical protein
MEDSGMLDFVGMVVVSFFGLMGFVVYFYMSGFVNESGYVIASGAVSGAPISTTHRWFLLFNHWVPHAAAIVCWAVLHAVVQVAIANYVNHTTVQLIAYLSAFLSGVAALGWVMGGALVFNNYRSILRQAEAD